MSLSERASGILETHVTWQDVELDMREALDTVATFGPYKTVKNIGEGNGFMSRIALIDPDWQNQGDEELPRRFIAKILSQLAWLDFAEKMKAKSPFADKAKEEQMARFLREAHTVEVTAYELLAKYAPGKVPIPKIYKFKAFSDSNPLKGYILMEHMDDLTAVHVIDNIDADSLRQPLRAAAAMNAASLKFSDEEKKRLSKGIFADFAALFTADVARAKMTSMKKHAPPELAEKIARMEAMIPEIFIKEKIEELDHLADTLGMTRVLCHGDMWSTNMLWSKGGGGFELRAFIDFQGAHFGCPSTDLCRLLCSNMGGKERRDNYMQLLRDYYGYLEEAVEGEMPFTFQQLLAGYELVLPLTGFLVLPGIPPFLDFIRNHGEKDRKHVSEEQIMEKMVALMDDIFEAHEKNMAAKK